MTTTHTSVPFQLGEPVEHRGIVVTPLFPLHDPRAEYLTLGVAIERGLLIEEVSVEGSVPELQVLNPLDEQVLLYDGEELIGAKQNRILNVSVLVAGRTKLPIPVSCVEQGRWHHVSESFSPASHSSSPSLRHAKSLVQHDDPLAPGISQGRVWGEVRSKLERMGVRSPTGSSADAYRQLDEPLTRLEAAFPLQPGQAGAVLALGDDLCLDYVSRPDAFELLYPKLLRGYLLDALERLDGSAARAEVIGAFVEAAAAASRTRRPSAGLGEDLRLDGDGVVGSGLELDGEVLQLSAFSRGREERTFGQITRPSRRRA